MALRCTLSGCAQMVMRDADSNTLSLISMIEEINVPGLPGMIGLSGVFFLERDMATDPDHVELVLRVTLAGVSVGEFPIAADFAGKAKGRVVVHAGGIPLISTGVLRFAIGRPGAPAHPLGFWDIDVKTAGPPMVVQQPTAN